MRPQAPECGGCGQARILAFTTPRHDRRSCLDEAIYSQVPSITEFVQQEPQNGAAVSESTTAWVVLDTFHDRRNGYLFYVSPVGSMFDGATTNERTSNADWNTIWKAKVTRSTDR